MNRFHLFLRLRMVTALTATSLLVAACGGGGGGVAVAENVGSGGTGVVSGTVTKGPVGNATVIAYSIHNGQAGAQIGTTSTDMSGNFSMAISSYAGPVMLQMSGGSYIDEATGTSMAMAQGDVMTAVMPSVAGTPNSSGVQVTPLTAMAQAMAQHMTGGMTDANIAAANRAMGNNFLVSDILHVQPMNPLVVGSGASASLDAQNYGMTLAAMSQYAQQMQSLNSSSLVTAMMMDATDGVLDGRAGTVPVQMGGMGGGMMLPPTAGTSGMGAAMDAFMRNPAKNKSGVMTPDLVIKLNGASGPVGSLPPVSLPPVTTPPVTTPPVSPPVGSVPPVPVMNTTVSGTAFNGAVSSGMVAAYAINNGTMGAQLASAPIDNQGSFTLQLGSYAGPVMLQMSGASYTDEASQKTMVMTRADVMSAVLPTVANGANISGVWMTPLTAMAQSRALGMSGGMTEANIAAANAAMGNYFLVSDILHTRPMNPIVTGSGAGASPDARNYGMTLAAMSQYAQTLNMTVSSTLVTAMMMDASDGVMNGKKGGSQVSMALGGMMGTGTMTSTAGTSSLASAMSAFMNSASNMSGLTVADMAALMQQLIASNGKI